MRRNLLVLALASVLLISLLGCQQEGRAIKFVDADVAPSYTYDEYSQQQPVQTIAGQEHYTTEFHTMPYDVLTSEWRETPSFVIENLMMYNFKSNSTTETTNKTHRIIIEKEENDEIKIEVEKIFDLKKPSEYEKKETRTDKKTNTTTVKHSKMREMSEWEGSGGNYTKVREFWDEEIINITTTSPLKGPDGKTGKKVEKVSFPEGSIEEWWYDDKGNLLRHRKDGVRTDYKNNTTRVTRPNGYYVETEVYDNNTTKRVTTGNSRCVCNPNDLNKKCWVLTKEYDEQGRETLDKRVNICNCIMYLGEKRCESEEIVTIINIYEETESRVKKTFNPQKLPEIAVVCTYETIYYHGGKYQVSTPTPCPF